MSLDFTGPPTVPLPRVPFGQLAPADRRTLPNGVVDAYPLAEAQATALARVLTATASATGNRIAVGSHPLGRPFAPHDLWRALDVLTAVHDTLRTSFAVEGHRVPLQLVHAEAAIPLTVHDLRGLDEPRRSAVQATHEALEREVPLPAAPPLRLAAQLESDGRLRLVLTYSPALLDARGAARLLSELVRVYDGGSAARSEPYAAHVAAERVSLGDPAQRDHWRRVTDACAPLLLPDGWGDPDHPGRRHHIRVPFGDLTDGLRTLAELADASVSTVLLAAHLRVLGSLTPEEAFHTAVLDGADRRLPERTPVGGMPKAPGLSALKPATAPYAAPAAGRGARFESLRRLQGSRGTASAQQTGRTPQPGAPGPDAPLALGVHRNAVAFPHRWAARSWRYLVADIHRRQTDTEPYRRHPWDAVRRAVRTAGRFADVVFDPAPAAGPDRDGTEFPLVVGVQGDALVLDAAYDRLDEAHGVLLAGLYREVLAAMARDPGGAAAAHRLPGELARDVLAAGAPSGPGRTSPLLPELVAARAAETPDAVAVVSGHATVDYRTLDAHANRVAHRLHELGAGQGDVIGVLLHRSPALPAVLLGVLRAGAAYVPLDPSVPAERLAHILQVSDAPLILTETALVARVPAAYAARAVAVDTPEETVALERQPAGSSAPVPGPDDPAYVIFTSGSTGTPKGVVVGHGALANLLHSFAELKGDWLAATSVSFDISALELYLPLITGGRMVLADDTEAKDPTALLRLVDTHRVTHVQATPSGWRLLLAVGFDRPAVTALAGGEELPVRLAADLRARVRTLTNVYGPTETAIWSASWQVPEGAAEVVLGQPLPGESLFVLDRALEPIPPGVAGELCIGGSGVALGYHCRPALTAARFVPDPHGAPGARLYRTGDLARRRSDGAVEFLGRIDTQVKIAGHRIELGEIHAALTSHPAIQDAVTVVREPSPGVKRIVAYVVVAGRIDVSALRRHLAGKVPGYMVPAAFVAIRRIPLSISGKVDHGALPAPCADTGAARCLRSPTQAWVSALCAEALGLRGLAPDDDFLEHGAQSLAVVRLLVRIRREHAIGLPLSALFERLTISGLSEAILAADPAATRPGAGSGTAPTDGDTSAREYKA
ncbi:amino acid adenylation domain-containing protein [Streptomyces halstedii]|uniref:amino acid adenylation domain-containing protein n=1 Tax=Streptomyces halstedii TaxID=1944 RepID=UPI003363EB6C